MTLEPLLTAPLAVKIHVATVLPAVVIGTWLIFVSTKGRPVHRGLGYVYLALISVTAIAAAFIHQINPKGFLGLSPIHLLVPLTLYGVVMAIVRARQHDWRGHRLAMLSVYIGGILLAGGFAFAPGRIMHAVVFGG